MPDQLDPNKARTQRTAEISTATESADLALASFTGEEFGDPSKHPFGGVRLTLDEHQHKIRFNRLLTESLVLSEEVLALSTEVSETLELNCELTVKGLTRLTEALIHLDSLHLSYAHLFADVTPFNPSWANLRRIKMALLNASQSWSDEARYGEKINLDAMHGLDLRELRGVMERAQDQGIIAKLFDRKLREGNEALRKLCIGSVPETYAERAQLVSDLQEVKERRFTVNRDRALFAQLFGSDWLHDDRPALTRWYETGRAVDFILRLREITGNLSNQEDLTKCFRNPTQIADVSDKLPLLKNALGRYSERLGELLELLDFDPVSRMHNFDSASIRSQSMHLRNWRDTADTLPALLEYNQQRAKRHQSDRR